MKKHEIIEGYIETGLKVIGKHKKKKRSGQYNIWNSDMIETVVEEVTKILPFLLFIWYISDYKSIFFLKLKISKMQ